MRTRRGEIGWADFLTAARQLQVNEPANLINIAQLLGVYEPRTSRARISPDISVERAPATRSPGASRAVNPDHPERDVATEGAPAQRVSAQRGGTNSTLARSAPHGGRDGLSFLESISVARGGTFVPIVPRRLARYSITDLLRQESASDRPDVDYLVDEIANLRPISTVSIQLEHTLSGSLLVVPDMSQAMAPYLEDARDLVREISALVSSSMLHILWADDELVLDPSRLIESCGGSVDRIVLISTFGATQGLLTSTLYRPAWQLFARLASLLDIDVTAIVPHRLSQWPFDPGKIRRIAWEDLPHLEGRAVA